MTIRASGIGDEDWSRSISRSGRVLPISTDKDVHFTEAITLKNQEKENLTGLESDKILIESVNIQSKQNLKYRLIFWSKDTFENPDLDLDSFKDEVELDLSSSPAFRIGNANQYYFDVRDLEIVYEDKDATREIHCSLQNLSGASKNAGVTGEVQLDISYSLRL